MRNSPPGTPVSPAETATLLASLRPELLRFACWLTRDRATAEDVVQEALLRAWRSREALKDRHAVRAWMLTIVRREHARLYERKRLDTLNLEEAMSAPDGGPVAPEEGEIAALRLAIFKLPDDYRIPLLMQVMGGFSAQEIARELELSTAAVLTRLFRARNRLRGVYGLTAEPARPAPAEESP